MLPETSQDGNKARIGLKTKLLIVVIGVGALPLVFAMTLSYFQGHKSLKGVIGASFKALAYETSTKIDLIIHEEIHKLALLSKSPPLVARVEGNENQGPGSANELLQSFLENDPDAVLSSAALYAKDLSGNIVASINSIPTESPSPPSNPSESKPIRVGDGWLGPFYRNEKVESFVFEISVPITNSANQKIGTLHWMIHAKEFLSPAVEPIMFGETGHVMLITSDGRVLDCPILPTGHKLTDANLVHAVTLPDADWAETKNDGHGNRELAIIGFSPVFSDYDSAPGTNGSQWFTFAWQSSGELFSPMMNLLTWISGAGFISLLLIGALGVVSANRLVRPILQLQKTAMAIGRGEKVKPLKISTGDEIEVLANEINTMNDLLAQTFSGLEKEVEEKTQEVHFLKEYMESILMSVPEVILIFDSNGKVEYANSAFEALTGLREQDYKGIPLDKIELSFRDRWQNISSELQDYCQGKLDPLPENPQARDYSARDPLAPRSIQAKSRKTIRIGEKVFAYQFFKVVIKELSDRRIGIIMKDITEEKKLLDQLTMADKLSGLGTLAAGIAHEMNNPLYSIMGFTEAIKEEKDPGKVETYANKVLERARHMGSVILNLSGYSRSSDKDTVQPTDINERIESAAEMALLDSYSDDIVLEKEFSKLPNLSAKPEEIQQIFNNIIRNSVQAMNGKGKITIHTALNHSAIEVRIRDTGPGIPQEYLSKVFDPFFTTKEQGKGTGLGLNIVHNIVQQYGGNIRVESEKGKGATFIISFPVN